MSARPAGRTMSCRPNVSANMSARAVAASCSIVRSPVPSSSSIQTALLRDQPDIAHFLQVLGVERVGHAQDRGELVDEQPILAIERDVRQVTLLRQPSPVIARDVRDDRGFVVRQAEDLRGRQQVLRVLVMGAQARRRCRCRAAAPPPAAAAARASPRPCSSLSSSKSRVASIATWRPCARSKRYLWPTASALASTWRSKSSAPSRPPGFAKSSSTPVRSDASRHDDLRALRFGEQRAIDEQRRHERFGFDRGQAEALDQRVLVEPLDLVAERQERVARDLAAAGLALLLQDLRGREAHVAADRDHVRDAAERNVEADLVDDVGDVPLQQRRAAGRG